MVSSERGTPVRQANTNVERERAFSLARERALINQVQNNYFTEMCGGSEAGSYLRLIDFLYLSTPGLRVIKKKRRMSQVSWAQKNW